MRNKYQYSSMRDKAGQLAWFDCQSRRWISRSTLIVRTGLTQQHIISFENGRDGRGYRESLSERTQRETECNVFLL